ncbi:MAG: hypothetical protein AB1491_11420 [Thermodesulfobacteriota bacterium]
MVSSHFRQWWRRLAQKWPWRRRGVPTWGEHPPTILGVCRECGAAVLKGWHREVEGGFLCQRCAHRSLRQ